MKLLSFADMFIISGASFSPGLTNNLGNEGEISIFGWHEAIIWKILVGGCFFNFLILFINLKLKPSHTLFICPKWVSFFKFGMQFG